MISGLKLIKVVDLFSAPGGLVTVHKVSTIARGFSPHEELTISEGISVLVLVMEL